MVYFCTPRHLLIEKLFRAFQFSPAAYTFLFSDAQTIKIFNNVDSNVPGPSSFDILEGHSKATMLLIANNAAQGILSSFFFKYAGQ